MANHNAQQKWPTKTANQNLKPNPLHATQLQANTASTLPGGTVEPLPRLLLDRVGQEVRELSEEIGVVREERRHLLQYVLDT